MGIELGKDSRCVSNFHENWNILIYIKTCNFILNRDHYLFISLGTVVYFILSQRGVMVHTIWLSALCLTTYEHSRSTTPHQSVYWPLMETDMQACCIHKRKKIDSLSCNYELLHHNYKKKILIMRKRSSAAFTIGLTVRLPAGRTGLSVRTIPMAWNACSVLTY